MPFRFLSAEHEDEEARRAGDADLHHEHPHRGQRRLDSARQGLRTYVLVLVVAAAPRMNLDTLLSRATADLVSSHLFKHTHTYTHLVLEETARFFLYLIS